MNEMRECLAGHAESILFLIVFGEQIGLPIPAAPLLMAAGAMSADGTLNPSIIMLITVAASLVADVIWYYLGWRGGMRIMGFFLKLFGYEPTGFGRIERLFAKHAILLVTTAKFLPWLGNIIPPFAGAFRMSPGRFLRYDVLSSILYAGFYIGCGIVFRAEVNTALEVLSEISLGRVAVAGMFIFVLWSAKNRSRPKVAAASAA